jgi:hypothetical protein
MGEMTKGGFYPVITRTVDNKASEVRAKSLEGSIITDGFFWYFSRGFRA